MNDYSLISLTPNEEVAKTLFWEFRVNEMWRQYKIWSIIVIVAFISSVATVLTDQSTNNICDVVNMTIVLVCQLLIFLISKRWKKSFIYLLPILLLVTYFGMLIKIWVLQEEDAKNDWTLERHQALTIELVAIGIGFFAFVILFCPSVTFLVLLYFPFYIAAHLT